MRGCVVRGLDLAPSAVHIPTHPLLARMGAGEEGMTGEERMSRDMDGRGSEVETPNHASPHPPSLAPSQSQSQSQTQPTQPTPVDTKPSIPETQVNLDPGDLERWDEVRRSYERGLEALVGLREGIPRTLGQLEGARRVDEELDGMGGGS